MNNTNTGKHLFAQHAPEAFPSDRTTLTASVEPLKQQPTRCTDIAYQCPVVAAYPVITDLARKVSAYTSFLNGRFASGVSMITPIEPFRDRLIGATLGSV